MNLQLVTTVFKELLKNPWGTVKQLIPECDCGAKTIAACSECGRSVCIKHGYICVQERDALCVKCVKEMRDVGS